MFRFIVTWGPLALVWTPLLIMGYGGVHPANQWSYVLNLFP